MNFPFAHPPCKTFQNDDPYSEFTCFYTSEKHDFGFFFRHLFWHWLLMSFGIDFGFILGPFGVISHVLSRSIFEWISDGIFNGFGTKMVPTLRGLAPPFLFFFAPVPSLFRRECLWRFLGSFCHPFGFVWVVFGTFLALILASKILLFGIRICKALADNR
jgi:hypothetical protein